MMTSFERIKNTFDFKPVDRIGYQVQPWKSTVKKWIQQGYLKEDEDPYEHFVCDVSGAGWINGTADLDFKEVVLEENENSRLLLDGNGATLRKMKEPDNVPEHVDFRVKDRRGWEMHIKPFLKTFDRRRIDFENYGRQRKFYGERQRYFTFCFAGPLEMIHPMCGHENMLMGMALDPEWVGDMFRTYTDVIMMHAEQLFAEKGTPHAFYMCEDMGYKFKPFMSPAMYKEIIMPSHKRLFDYAHSLGCKVIVHSCGYVADLVPYMIEAGMNCLQAMEVKAGMDLPTLFKKYGDKIVFFGGNDARTLVSNDREQIEAELRRNIIPLVEGGGAYILHSDHSEPPDVEYETMKFFVKRGCEIASLQY